MDCQNFIELHCISHYIQRISGGQWNWFSGEYVGKLQPCAHLGPCGNDERAAGATILIQFHSSIFKTNSCQFSNKKVTNSIKLLQKLWASLHLSPCLIRQLCSWAWGGSKKGVIEMCFKRALTQKCLCLFWKQGQKTFAS